MGFSIAGASMSLGVDHRLYMDWESGKEDYPPYLVLACYWLYYKHKLGQDKMIDNLRGDDETVH